jgi:hypothetical protein
MLRLLIDENFNQRILRGLRLRLPSLDYVVVQETDMQGLQDAPLLQQAAVLQRVLVTHDLKTVPRHAYACVAAGEPMPGIIAIPDDLPIGQAIRYGNLDPGGACLAIAGLTLWLLGYPDQALERVNEVLTLAQNLEHPYTLARAGLYYTTLVHQLRREWQMVSERAETAITVATAQQIALALAVGPIMRGWALAMQGQGAEGLVQLRQGLDPYRATGAALQRSHFLGMLAEVHSSMGQ